MSLEDDIQALSIALKENTAALRAAIEAADGGAPPAVKPVKPVKADKPAKKAPPVEEAEEEEAEEEEAEEEEAEEEEEVADEDLTAEVAAAAKKAIINNKPATIAVLKKLGVSKVSEIETDDHAKAIKLFKAIK